MTSILHFNEGSFFFNGNRDSTLSSFCTVQEQPIFVAGVVWNSNSDRGFDSFPGHLVHANLTKLLSLKAFYWLQTECLLFRVSYGQW